MFYLLGNLYEIIIRFSPTTTQIVFYGGFGLAQHLFWSSKATQRL